MVQLITRLLLQYIVAFNRKFPRPSPRTNYERGGSAFGSFRTDLTSSRAPGTSAESTKAGGLARDKVRNGRWRVRCRLLSSYSEKPSSTSVTKRFPEKYRDELTHCQNYPRPRLLFKTAVQASPGVPQGATFEIDTCKSSSLEVARRPHHARWRRKEIGYYCHSGNQPQVRGFSPASRFVRVVLVLEGIPFQS
jgi:hypothetical protein